MGDLYKCDWERSEECIGISESRADFMSFRAGNDEQTETLACYPCVPDFVPVPSHGERKRGSDS